MYKRYKYYPVLHIIISLLLFSCYDKKSEISGTWESILIENQSPLFRKTLPTSIKGEVLLTLGKDENFNWINKTEKLNLSGKYGISGKKIIFIIDSEKNPLSVDYKLDNNRLVITTEDRFIFTFTKKD